MNGKDPPARRSPEAAAEPVSGTPSRPVPGAPSRLMTGPSRSRWLFLLQPKWLGWHAFAVVAVAGMLWLGDWQLRRAEAGNALSWAYTFEWPIFAVLAVVFWAKTILDELASPGAGRRPADEIQLPAGTGAQAGFRPEMLAGRDEDDPELAAYNAYVARLNAEVRGHGRWHGIR